MPKPWLLLVLVIALFGGKPRAQGPGPVPPPPSPPASAPFPADGGAGPDGRAQTAIRDKLSTLWLCVSLNMIGADVLSSYIPGTQDEVIDFAGGKDEVQYFMLAGAVIYEIPIGMIFLSKYLPYSANRWTNVGMSALSALTIVGGGSWHPHYVFAASMEVLALGYIAWTALHWPRPGSAADGKHDLGLRLDPRGNGAGIAYAYHF